MGTGEDVGAFAAGLQRGGYATDPDYVQKLSATVASVRALRAADGAVSLKLQADAPITGETMTGSISGGGSSGGGETSA